MTETLLLLGGVSLLAVGAATLFVAVITLRTARRYVDLAEERLEHLREGQDRLIAHLEEQRRVTVEEREEAEPYVHAYQSAELSVEQARREPLGRRALRRSPAEAPEAGGRPKGVPPGESPKARKAARPPTGSPGEDGRPGRAVRRPHPDDDVEPGRTLAGRVRASGDSPIQMFRVFYERYLDNYEGYVKLAARIHHARTDEEKVPGSRAERGWKERLRRVHDGIERTTERLDILEHSNPELALDDRVARRAGIARSHSQITR